MYFISMELEEERNYTTHPEQSPQSLKYRMIHTFKNECLHFPGGQDKEIRQVMLIWKNLYNTWTD